MQSVPSQPESSLQRYLTRKPWGGSGLEGNKILDLTFFLCGSFRSFLSELMAEREVFCFQYLFKQLPYLFSYSTDKYRKTMW